MSYFPEPRKIAVVGDLHGNGAWAQAVIQLARKNGVDAIVQVGDFGWWLPYWDGVRYLRSVQKNLEECGITLYWVDGNHENHDDIAERLEESKGQPWSSPHCPNIIHLPRGFRWQWWDRTWLALGGAHSVDSHLRTEGKSWWPAERITDSQAMRAIRGGSADIMVTHDCPDGVAIPGVHADEKLDAETSFWPVEQIRTANAHRRQLGRVVDVVKPRYLFCGHYHVRIQRLREISDTIVNILNCDVSELDQNMLFLTRPHEGDSVLEG